MKSYYLVPVLLLCSSCASSSYIQSAPRQTSETPAPSVRGPNWEEIDKGTARTEEVARKKKESQKASERTYIKNGDTIYEKTIWSSSENP
jgi:hypothetical protein